MIEIRHGINQEERRAKKQLLDDFYGNRSGSAIMQNSKFKDSPTLALEEFEAKWKKFLAEKVRYEKYSFISFEFVRRWSEF